jgi:hypothetical protein
MSFENLNPKDVVKLVTTDGTELEADVISLKRDRIQLRVIGPWLTERQIRDARRSIKYADVARVTRLGRGSDYRPAPMPMPPKPAISVPSYVASFFKFLRS